MRRKGPGSIEERLIRKIDRGSRPGGPRGQGRSNPQTRAVRRNKEGVLVPVEMTGKER